MPGKLAHACIALAVVLIVLGTVSLMMRHPLVGFSARHMGGGAALLLLLAINLHQCASSCLVEKKS